MAMIMHRALALRLEIALLVLPIALLWGRTDEGVSGRGVLAALGVTLLAIFLFGSLDAALLGAGKARRYSPSSRTLESSLHAAQALRLISGMALALASLVLLFVEWRLGGFLLVCLAAGAIVLRRRPSGSGRTILPMFAAPLLTAILLVIPPVLAAMPAWAASSAIPALTEASGAGAAAPSVHGTAPMPAFVLAATGLAALLLLAFLLLCSIRDETADTFDELPTVAARRGRGGAVAIGALLAIGLIILGSVGVSRGWWPWGVSVGASVLVVVASWLLAARADQAAAKLWALGQLGLAWSLFLGPTS